MCVWATSVKMLQIEVSIINSYMGEVQTTYNSQFRKATEQMESLRADVDTHSSTMVRRVHRNDPLWLVF